MSGKIIIATKYYHNYTINPFMSKVKLLFKFLNKNNIKLTRLKIKKLIIFNCHPCQ